MPTMHDNNMQDNEDDTENKEADNNDEEDNGAGKLTTMKETVSFQKNTLAWSIAVRSTGNVRVASWRYSAP